MPKFQYYFLLLFSIFIQSCNSHKHLKFELYTDVIHPRSENNNLKGQGGKKRSLIYFVHNYHFSRETEKAIDDFACQQYANLPDSIYLLDISFYKHSKITNKEYLTEHPDEIFEAPLFSNEGSSLSRDHLWAYRFFRKKGCISKYKVKNYEHLIFHFEEPDCGHVK